MKRERKRYLKLVNSVRSGTTTAQLIQYALEIAALKAKAAVDMQECDPHILRLLPEMIQAIYRLHFEKLWHGKKPIYKTKWKPYSKNKTYWREVLEGRTVVKIEFDRKGISALVLDSGERLYPHPTGRFCINN